VTETLGQDDNLYNLAFDISKRTLSIQLLEKEDETFELNDLGDYTNYVSNYIDWEHDTPGIQRKHMNTQFLKRYVVFFYTVEHLNSLLFNIETYYPIL
jgi:histone deacetylase complex regulatory component SIN3